MFKRNSVRKLSDILISTTYNIEAVTPLEKASAIILGIGIKRLGERIVKRLLPNLRLNSVGKIIITDSICDAIYSARSISNLPSDKIPSKTIKNTWKRHANECLTPKASSTYRRTVTLAPIQEIRVY